MEKNLYPVAKGLLGVFRGVKKKILPSLFSLLFVVIGLSAQDQSLSILAQKATDNSNFNIGKQYAVIIGINRYQNWMPLKDAVTEAQSLKRVLAADYYIDDFIELYDTDASASNIRKLFSETLPAQLGVHDSLLVFYAGHGYLDTSKSGFWIPVDGGTDTLTQDRWIPNSQLRNYLKQLPAQRVLVIADSCFSGDFLNTSRGLQVAPNFDAAYYKQALQLTARQALSSGASENVPDESEFADELVGYLERNTEPMVDALSMYDRLRKGMTQTLPLYGTLPGNENGASFVLFRKQPEPQAAALPPPQSERPLPQPATPLQQESSVTGLAATPVVTLHVKAGSAYKAWAMPKGKSDAAPIAVQDGARLPTGIWDIKAQLPDDVEPTWSKTLFVPEAADIALTIPALTHSTTWQVNALNNQRAIIVPELETKEATYKAQKAWGWVSLLAGLAGTAIAGYAWFDGQAAYSTYQTASGSTANSARSQIDKDTLMLWAGVGTGGVGISVSSLLFLINPAAADRAKVNQLDSQITQLKSGSAESAQ